MFRLPDTTRKLLFTITTRRLLFAILLTGLLAQALPAPLAQTRHTRQRSGTAAVAKPTPTPTPVVVPRRPPSSSQQSGTTPRPTPTPAIIFVPSQGDDAPPPPRRPTPTPTPVPVKKADEVVDESEVVRVTSNLVVVPVAVTDSLGNAVQGLKREDFRLEEEGRAQELAAVGDADQVPLDIAVVFDISSSVTKNFEFEKQTAAGFLKEVLKPIDRAAVFTISERPQLAQPLAAASTTTTRLVSIPAAEKPTGTAFYDTVTAAARYLAANAPARNRRVIVVISDGEDNFSDDVREAIFAEVRKGADPKEALEKQSGLHRRAAEKVLREVQHADAVFYSINPSGPSIRLNVISQRAQDQMKMLADSTGGNSFLPPRLEDLETIFRQIAAELRAQYLLQYLSNTQATAGKFLRIKVSTPARTDLRIRARQGYYKKG
ncbi:MAG: Ca-activated chloride channel [Acidobacteriota bacterium]|nr:Ca-activated chloride channel [Acidobacteriota bacterium]